MDELNKVTCIHCGKKFAVKGIGSHLWRKHGAGIGMPAPNKGKTSWNAGLTRQTDPRVNEMALKNEKPKPKVVPGTCEFCFKLHDGTYGVGRFCRAHCARSFAAYVNKEEANTKIRESLLRYFESKPKSIKKKSLKKLLDEKQCQQCKSTFIPSKTTSKFCSRSCVGKFSYSCRKVSKRSKNEVMFADLCQRNFKNVICNVPMFSGWDADVIFLDEKIAVLWNGIWHYQCIAGHPLKQVQKRDEIKTARIIEAKFTPYVIKDLGGFDPKLVAVEFEKFSKYLLSRDRA